MSFEIQLAHGVQEVGQEAWDQLSEGRPFTSYRWYAFGERAMPYARPYYLILLDDGQPLARATFWLTNRELMPTESPVVNTVMETILRRWPLLLCQAPISSAASSGLVLPRGPRRGDALAALAEAAWDLLYQVGGSFAIFSYLEEADTALDGWPNPYRAGTTPGPGTRLTIEWSDFDAYLAGMSKKRRYNIRRTQRLAEEQGIEVKAYSGVTDVERALTLHRNVNQHHNAPTEPWMRGALENAEMVDSVFLTAQIDGAIAGCELMLGDGGWWMVTGLGLDYEFQNVYFVLGYADIQQAIERGARGLRWGSMTYDVKERLGFVKESNNHDVFAGRGLFQRLGEWVADKWT